MLNNHLLHDIILQNFVLKSLNSSLSNYLEGQFKKS